MNSKSHRGAALTGRALLATLAGSGLVAAVQAAEPAAADPVAELTQPHSVVEIGIGNVSDDSFKFGEYNGLQDKGVYGVGGFDLRGGGSYDSGDTTRWRLSGTDLGLDTRSVLGEYGQQGKFRLSFGYDELRRNRSDSYSTPYLGAGGSVVTLPSNWIVPVVPRLGAAAPNARGLLAAVGTSNAILAGVNAAPSAAQLAVSNALIAADLPAFAQHDIYTTRKRLDAGVSAVLSPKWEFAVSARRENRDGAKPMGSVTRASGGDISTILADPIDQRTDQVTATLGYRTTGNFVQLGYYASRFQNDVRSLTWQNWALPAANATMSSAPSNQMNQFSVTVGHEFSATTRLVASGAYGRNTQDGTFLTDASTVLVPVTSLDGKVVNTAFNVKLTSRPLDALRLAVAYKYDMRDNQTPVHIFGYYDANEPAGAANINAAFATALGVPATQLRSNTNVNANRPHSRRVNALNADADLRLGDHQSLKGSYEFERLERWCEGTWINCAEAPDSDENTLRLEWRAAPTDGLNTRLSYAWSDRKVKKYDENAFLALVPLANVSPTGATGGASAYSFMTANGWNGYGPVAGVATTTGNMNLFFPLNNVLANATYGNQNRISELLGMRRYNTADRQRDRVVGNLDWQASETLSLTADAEYSDDDYANSAYGLTASRDVAANLEANWNPLEGLALSAFYTHEDLRARSAGNTYTANSTAANVGGFTAISGGCYATIALRNASNKIDPCLNWRSDRRDKTDLYGLTVNRNGLFTSKLDVAAELVVTRVRSDNDVIGGNYVNNPLAVAGAPVGTIAAYYIAATPLPRVISRSTELHLKASYALSSVSTLRFYYTYGHLRTNDYAYEGMQFGGLAGVLPSLEVAPVYTVQAVALSYSHRF